MKLTYIYHSCYAIETEKIIVIIDYYQDTDNVIKKLLAEQSKEIYVLCTHSHHDHFNDEILEWKLEREDIKYIFSSEVKDVHKLDQDFIVYLDKLEVYKDKNLIVKAYGSTDVGGSFLIHIDDKQIFHAGDLNNWHWNEESTNEEIKEAEDFYEKELKLLSADVKYLDLAMFPIDPRLGKDYMKGAEQFVEEIKTEMLAPMHFGEAYDKISAFNDFAETKGCKLLCWDNKNQSINF